MTTGAIALASFLLGGYVNARLDRRARERALGNHDEVQRQRETRDDLRRRLGRS